MAKSLQYIPKHKTDQVFNLKESLSIKAGKDNKRYYELINQIDALPLDSVAKALKNLNNQTLDKYIDILLKVESNELRATEAKVMLDVLKAIDARISAVIDPKDKPKEFNVNISLANRLEHALTKINSTPEALDDEVIEAKCTKTPIIDKNIPKIT